MQEGANRPVPAASDVVDKAEEAPVPDEVMDLKQRLSILQTKRTEDKARIKELEKYKAQYLQVNLLLLLTCCC